MELLYHFFSFIFGFLFLLSCGPINHWLRKKIDSVYKVDLVYLFFTSFINIFFVLSISPDYVFSGIIGVIGGALVGCYLFNILPSKNITTEIV
jgi:hypothetical protein